MDLYGKWQLADSMRAVRANTIAIAGDIPGDRYDFRATPTTRSIGETLVHIAWLFTSDLAIHEKARISTVEGFDFTALMKTSEVEEQHQRAKADIIELLRSAGEAQAAWVGNASDAFLAERVAFPGGSTSRFEMLLATKEHELQHRAQVTVLERLIGVTPRFTALS